MCQPPTTPAAFQTQFEALIAKLPAGLLREYRLLELPSDQPPWQDSGLALERGEQITSFAVGQTTLKGTGIWFGAGFQLWFRIGPLGEVFRGTRPSHSFSAPQSGPLELASYFPGEWASPQGTLAVPEEAYQMVEGKLWVLLLRWQGEAETGLRALASLGDVEGMVAQELNRLENPVALPEGWRYLWFIGPAEIYRPCQTQDRNHAICCHTRSDVGLLQKDVLLPLQADTRLRWAWRMEALPSAIREDDLASHDYLSIAVEFDNGQDLTYYWSAELPVGTAYRCPIPTWTARETHWVVRSGTQNLGEWLDEERNVFADYQAAIGGAMPAHIVRVWLIAVSLFQHGEGKCQFADIALVNGDEVRQVAA